MLENLLRERASAGKKPVEVELRAYELAPDAPVTPVESMEQHFMKEHDVTAEEARRQMERITKMAARAGLHYDLAGVKVCNTFDAHRLMKLAYDTTDAQTALKLNFALFHANFVENRQLSDHSVLTDIALGVGLDASAVQATLSSQRYADAVRADEEEAEKIDLEYVPYMQFGDGHVLQGVISVGAMRKSLEED